MARTTLDIDNPVLDEVKRIQRRERRSLGQVITTLLAEALALRRTGEPAGELKWLARPMGARIDLFDKETLYSGLDETQGR